jgi:hypothetical protein
MICSVFSLLFGILVALSFVRNHTLFRASTGGSGHSSIPAPPETWNPAQTLLLGDLRRPLLETPDRLERDYLATRATSSMVRWESKAAIASSFSPNGQPDKNH